MNAGADDVEDLGDSWLVTTQKAALETVREAIVKAGMDVDNAELAKLPKTKKTVEGRNAEVLIDLVETLEDHEDVQKVFSDFELSDEALAQLSS